ncbi:MAG TPA: hypothetical protein V6D05_18175 [Stenomitos sp.]
MALTTTDIGASITFSPQWWHLISSTRIFMASFCGQSFGDSDLSDRIAMCAHELLENAVKYSVTQDSPVNCTMHIQHDRVLVTVENHADPSHLDVLREEFDVVCQGDPMEMYINKMSASLESDKSQLGLARIRAEGEAELKLSTENGIVSVQAIFHLPDDLKGAVN